MKIRKDNNSNTPVRMPRRKMPLFESWILPVFSIGTGLMTFTAANNLLDSPIKAVLIGSTATLVSYAINRFSIEKGAELAATGFKLAGIVSVISIIAVGVGLFPSTYAGLVIHDVDELQIHQYLSNQDRFIDERNKLATKSTRLIPIIQVNEEELIQYRDCELRESCLSGRSIGGRGIVTKTLEEKARRAGVIAKQLESGDTVRKTSLKKLNELRESFLKTFSETDKSIKERRRSLIAIDAKINQEIAILDEALPVSLLQAYVSELEAGVTIRNRAIATKGLNKLLKKHAQGLSSVLSTLKSSDEESPQFPFPAGVSATFKYISHFLPIAALAACIELIFPLTLWVYVFLGLIWQKHKEDHFRNDYAPEAEINSTTKKTANKRPTHRRRNHKQLK